MKRALTLLVVFGCLAAVIGGVFYSRAANKKVRVFKLGHGLNESHTVHQGMVRFAAEVLEKTDGAIKIEVFPSAQLGSERENLEQLQMGLLEFTKASAASLESFIPALTLFSLPYLFTGREQYWQLLDGKLGQDLLNEGVPVWLRGICYYSSGSRSFYTTSKPILTPDDLIGLKIRVMESPTAMNLIRTLGGAPTPISWGELYTALQQGVVDGAENNEPSVATSRHYEVCKHYSLDEHTMVPDMLLISEKLWVRLTPEEQKIILTAAHNSSVWQRAAWDEQVKESLAEIEKGGTKIYHPDKQPFIDKVQPMIEQYHNKPYWKYVEVIRAFKPQSQEAVK